MPIIPNNDVNPTHPMPMCPMEARPSRARARGGVLFTLSQRRRRVLVRPPDALPLSGVRLALWGASGRCAITRSSRAPPLEEHTQRHRPTSPLLSRRSRSRRAARLTSRRQHAGVDAHPPLALSGCDERTEGGWRFAAHGEPPGSSPGASSPGWRSTTRRRTAASTFPFLPPAPVNSATSKSPHAVNDSRRSATSSAGRRAPRARMALQSLPQPRTADQPRPCPAGHYGARLGGASAALLASG